MADKYDQIANSNSCLNKAQDGEPLFILRANDELAPDAVRLWAERYRARWYLINTRSWVGTRQEKKYYEALELAQAMEVWKREHA